MENEKKSGAVGRIVAIILVAVAFIALIVASFSMGQKSPGEQAWDIRTTIGAEDAIRSYVMYTDLMCPYCDVFSREVMNHWDEFQEMLAEHKILFEVRMTDTLYMGYGAKMNHSRLAAEAAYCATEEDKFWEFYHAALAALWDDYHSKGVGVNKTATPISDMPDDYWQKIGHKIGLGEEFDACVNEGKMSEKVTANTIKASQVAQGMPTFVFGKFTTSGFSDTWDWEYVKMYLEAGL